ncbi:MAG TPA: hypothetical protein VK255_03370 [Patescibacteria group bacterium]|nr:hypothetical protein [Patescibacteria group bacterium]
MDKNEMREKLNNKINDLSEKASDKYQDWADSLEFNRARVSRFARRNPEKTIALSFGAGILAGMTIFFIINKNKY